jgi:aspartate aminotransferase-like enzyme
MPEFFDLFKKCSEKLKPLFGTSGGDVAILTSSGTGAMEAAVLNFTRRGDEVVVISGGKFGRRFGDVCEVAGLKVRSLEVQPGTPASAEELDKLLAANPGVVAVFSVHCETSTGTINPAPDLCRVAHQHDALFVLDGVSTLGVYPIDFDANGYDVMISASQKAMMTPPGLSFVCVRQGLKPVARRSYYFDLEAAIDGSRRGFSPFTPGIPTVLALLKAIALMEKEGFDQVYRRHELMAKGARAGVGKLGLKVFSKAPTNGVTAVEMPEGLDSEVVRDKLIEVAHIRIAIGQMELKNRLVRIGHMGYCTTDDVVRVIEGLGHALNALGHECDADAAARAAADAMK